MRLVSRTAIAGVGAPRSPAVIYTLLAAVAREILAQPFYNAVRRRTKLRLARPSRLKGA